MIFTELYTTFMEEVTKVVCLEGSFESGEILKIFIIITIKGNNRIDTFLFFYFLPPLHHPFTPPTTC
jgi:hypothetical protein